MTVKPEVNFHRDPNEGQLCVAERRKVYEIITAVRPKKVFEVGTWKGGGSTYIIASALWQNGSGILYTVENCREFFDLCQLLYAHELSYLKPFIKFHFGDSVPVFTPLLKKLDRVDALFLDGAEDAAQTFAEFLLFRDKLREGAVLMCHDWRTLKAAKLRPFIERSTEWENIALLNEGMTGFAAFRRK
jgi:predicted O-methyltransferase YrrM